MTAKEARALRLARKQAERQAYYASRRSYRECLAGEKAKPAKGSKCSEPRHDVVAKFASQREREMRIESEVWPVDAMGVSLGSGT